MKYLLLLIPLLFGCGPSEKELIQDQINSFTRECQELAKCMDARGTVEVKLTSATPLSCEVQPIGLKSAHVFSVVWDTDITQETPSFGHLKSAIHVCEYFKGLGIHAKDRTAQEILYSKCVDKENKDYCWEKYKRGDFIPGRKK